MSDGAGESGRGHSQRRKVSSSGCASGSKVSSVDDFGRAVSRIAVAQVCESVGFQGVQSSALDALSDVATRYISDLAKSAAFYADLAGRTQCNVFDIVQGLEDLGSTYGFPGASDIDHCLVGSGVVRDITQFVNTTEEFPFARPIPHFPVVRSGNHMPSFEQVGETTPGNHVPSWLPALPDPHTYIQTPVWHEKVMDAKADMLEQVKQRRKAESSLLSLQQHLAGNNTFLRKKKQQVNTWKGKQLVSSEAAELNPFLAPPLPFGEKEVSQLAIPEENAKTKTVSVLETFAPALEAMKSGELETGEDNKSLPTRRPIVQFKLGIGKKELTGPLPMGIKTSLDTASMLLRDDGRDEKKRRAKMILKESMDKPQELHQL